MITYRQVYFATIFCDGDGQHDEGCNASVCIDIPNISESEVDTIMTEKYCWKIKITGGEWEKHVKEHICPYCQGKEAEDEAQD